MIKFTDIYLVDCENVGLKKLSVDKKSLVYYFTSNLSYITNIQKWEREIHIFHNCTKNSLDFIIDSKLGFLIRHYGKKMRYHIVSSDKGFDLITKFWQTQGYSVSRSKDYTCDYNNIDKAKLTYEYASAISGFSRKDLRKLRNVYASWFRSKARDYNILHKQIVRSFYLALGKDKCDTICNYLFHVGLEVIN